MGGHTQRELATLTLAADKVLTGDLESALESQLQRCFKTDNKNQSVGQIMDMLEDPRVRSHVHRHEEITEM